MTTTDISTVDLEVTEARATCDRIKRSVSAITEDLVTLYAGRGWIALGYASWADLCFHELDGVQIAPPSRRSVVNELREAGLSTRAIASATGASVGTVHSDIAAGVQNRTPAAEAEIVVSKVENISFKSTTGIDGKVYPSRRPTPVAPATKPKRKPLSDDIRKATYDLEKLAKRFRKIEQDDRFPQFAELLAANSWFTNAIDDLVRIRAAGRGDR